MSDSTSSEPAVSPSGQETSPPPLTTVSVRILDKEYQVRCPEDEVDTLTQSARLLDERMAEIKGSGKVVGTDRIAVMAALNIASELFSRTAAESALSEVVQGQVADLTERVTRSLADHKQLDL